MTTEPKNQTRRFQTRARVALPAVPSARCGVCKSVNRWPTALPGTVKRFFCMTCERNTTHQKISEP